MRTHTLIKAFIILLLIGGIGLLSYPFICNAINQYRNDKIIEEYDSIMEDVSEKDAQNMLNEARAYNLEHPSVVIIDTFGEHENSMSEDSSYRRILDPIGDGSMGYINIPKINVRLVIYHGTREDVLQHGCGHLQGSSFPVGGENTHCILAAHRGLPTAKLFTDLDRLEKGDQFIIIVAREKLAYKIDSINVVKPEDLTSLQNDHADDRVTLLTCTPYGVNSHRLLVSGHRVPYIEEETEHNIDIRILIIIFVILLIMLVIVINAIRKRKSKRRAN